MFRATGEWTIQLYNQATPLSGPVRAMATERPGGLEEWEYEVLPWTLSTPLSSLVWDALDPRTPPARGQGHLVLDPDAQVLRQWRNNQKAEMYHPAREGGFVPVAEVGAAPDGPLYQLYSRDTLPFEDENGLVPYGPYAPR